MVDYVTGGKLLFDIVDRDTHFDHKHHYVVRKVSNFINRLGLIVGFACDDDLGAFFSDLFKNFVNSLFKKVGSIGALRLFGLTAYEQVVKPLHREGVVFVAFKNRIVKAGISTRMAGGTLLIYEDGKGVTVAVGSNAYYMLKIARGLPFSPKLLSGTGEKAGLLLSYRDL